MFSLSFVLSLFLFTSAQANSLWMIQKDSWSDSDEKNYSAFVAALGKANCNSFDACIKSAANPYRNSDPQGVKFFTDCADLPYSLRAYFAWKNKLPFTMVTQVVSADGSDRDIRYSPNGNLVKRRLDFVAKQENTFPDAMQVLTKIPDVISSAMFRFHPEIKNDVVEINGQKLARLVPDFYPTGVNREAIRPGTVIYDPNGHVAVVYEIKNDGRILFMDAHPDNSLTRGTYGKKFLRSRPGMGSGFKNFRPVKLVGARPDSRGNLIGGTVYLVPDSRLKHYSTVQFYGTKRGTTWNRGIFEVGNAPVDYYEWVRLQLAGVNLKFHPVEELKNMMSALCGDIKDRVAAVQAAIADGIHKRSQPATLPNNIYGTSGDWETYSSPSRDARLKTSFVELFEQTKNMYVRYQARDARIDYTGGNLKRDLLDAYEEQDAACVITYIKSDGTKQNLSFEDVRRRLFALSFDPYHCAERRWGASGSELASCRDDATKKAWYEAEQRLRNQIDRTYDVKMGFTLDQLRARVPGSGVDKAPFVDTKGYLESL